jgi:hypothetical protein
MHRHLFHSKRGGGIYILNETSACVSMDSTIAFHSQILDLFQFTGELSNSHMHEFPQNSIYSYNKIVDSLRKIHISENREEITVQRLIYQEVN